MDVDLAPADGTVVLLRALHDELAPVTIKAGGYAAWVGSVAVHLLVGPAASEEGDAV